MSFNGQSNPWQRNNVNVFQSLSGQQSMFLQQPHATMTSFGHSPIFSSNATGTISYPQTRASGLNPVAFQQQQQQQQQAATAGQSHYNSMGTVTKLNGDCGLVNDEVLFYRHVCKGPTPIVGDRVMFEATYSGSGQFKWTASRVQILTAQNQTQQPQPLMQNNAAKSSGFSGISSQGDYQRAQQSHMRKSPRRSLDRDRHMRNDRRDRVRHSRDRDEEENDRKRRREEPNRDRANNVMLNRPPHNAIGRFERNRDEPKRDRNFSLERKDRDRDRDRERERERDRDREKEKDRSERSPYKMVSKGHRGRAIRRYSVQIPKLILSYKQADIQELRKRYATLYIPSDFFHANIKWPDAFPADNPFTLRRPCQFHIMHKIVEAPYEQTTDELEPADADYRYSAKVMLMACPPIAELYQKCFEEEDSDTEHTVHPSRLISFLVGTRGRNEPMAIGGPWSPSLDGENPDKDPAVLIRTAIRTCKALTGIDLSNCSQWYRFVELHYHRSDYKCKEKEKDKEKESSSRVETVVIYLPDVNSCLPQLEDWQSISDSYKSAVNELIARKTNAAKVAAATAAKATTSGDNESSHFPLASSSATEAEATAASTSTSTSTTTLGDHSQNDTNKHSVGDGGNNNDAIATHPPNPSEPSSSLAASTTVGMPIGMADSSQEIAENAEDGDNIENEKIKPECIHYSKLDLKTMQVHDIRNQLIARNLPANGARNVLMSRLVKALSAEKNSERKAEERHSTQSNASKDVGDITDDTNEKTDKEIDEKMHEIEELEDWIDIMDVDLNDIVILDEYDASKNPESVTETDGPKELDEKERTQLIRRYTLPSNPHIIVHPNKLAKGGKFDCSVMSLSVLLDYHLEDTKERFFEVSLFAELFNEMLMRDFGFNIYKELYLYKEETLDKRDEETVTKKDDKQGPPKDEDQAVEHNEQKTQIESVADASTERNVPKVEEDDTQSTKSANDRKRKSINIGKDRDIGNDKKMIVVKPQLLLSFVYFDVSHCGFIYEKDLEDLFSILGLNLSRSQIRKILSKVTTKQAIYYRKLTEREEVVGATPIIEDNTDISPEDLKKIALGNRQFGFIFDTSNNGSSTITGASSELQGTTINDAEGMMNYNGTVINVGKLIEQIKRTENAYADLEKIYNDLRRNHAELHKEHSRSSGKIKDLQSEVKTLTKKVTEFDQNVFSLNRKNKDQLATLSYIYNRVAPYFAREKDKDKDKEHKLDRDKECDKDKEREKQCKDKDKEKEKDKSKESFKENKNSNEMKAKEETKEKTEDKEDLSEMPNEDGNDIIAK